jgi:hypothetical protein
MYEDPEENESEQPAEQASNPKQRAQEKMDEFRMHAELAAVFEGPRKFEAEVIPGLDGDVARDVQKTMAKLAKAKSQAEIPVLLEDSIPEAKRLLDLGKSNDLSTNDYHIHRRPGEVMIVRLLAGSQVDSYYTRLQAHFDAALNQYRQEERQSKGWKQDADALAYLDALDSIELKMEERYLRPLIKQHNLFVLSDQTADEIDILLITDYLMGLEAADLVGSASAPPDEPTEQDRAWFFKLFSLRGMIEGEERMCFFAFLQKTDESW